MTIKKEKRRTKTSSIGPGTTEAEIHLFYARLLSLRKVVPYQYNITPGEFLDPRRNSAKVVVGLLLTRGQVQHGSTQPARSFRVGWQSCFHHPGWHFLYGCSSNSNIVI